MIGSIALPHSFQIEPEKRIGDHEKGYVQICEDPDACHINPSKTRNTLLILTFIGLWTLPLLMLYVLLPEAVFLPEGLFFTQAAFLTFGGAYAVLAYIGQAGVEHFGWLTAPQMIDGLGSASFVAIQWKKLNIITVVLVCGGVGLVRGLLF